MPSLYTEDQTLARPAIDKDSLELRGWTALQISGADKPNVPERLLRLARELGTPTATRSGGGLFDVLSPTAAANSEPRSLSKQHALGEFPIHVDTAHWPTPCRYVMLACIAPGVGDRPTILMDSRDLPLSTRRTALLHCTPLRVTNGRNSFFSTILSSSRAFVRFDTGCMTATSPDGIEALEILSRRHWPDRIEQIHWAPGFVLILDNWRMLHGRAEAAEPDPDRKLLRISIT